MKYIDMDSLNSLTLDPDFYSNHNGLVYSLPSFSSEEYRRCCRGLDNKLSKDPYVFLRRDSFCLDPTTPLSLGISLWKYLVLYVFSLPVQDLPLYVNAKDRGVSLLVKYRLSKGV